MSDDDDFGECSKRDEDLTLPKGMDACALRLLAWKCMLHLRSIRRGAALDALTKRVVLGAATVSKMIKEMLPNDIRCANDTRDLILDCCVGTLLLCLSHQLRGSEPACAEFIHLISSEANEMCNKESKKTIGGEHVMKALEAQPLTIHSRPRAARAARNFQCICGHNDARFLQNLGFSQYLPQAQEVLDQYKNEVHVMSNMPCDALATNTPFHSAYDATSMTRA
jgi:hypothetical protein